MVAKNGLLTNAGSKLSERPFLPNMNSPKSLFLKQDRMIMPPLNESSSILNKEDVSKRCPPAVENISGVNASPIYIYGDNCDIDVSGNIGPCLSDKVSVSISVISDLNPLAARFYPSPLITSRNIITRPTSNFINVISASWSMSR